MSTTNKIIIAILVLLAVVLGGFGYYTANRALTGRASEQAAKTQAQATQATHPVVVATKTLPAGLPIAQDAVKVLAYPMAPQGAYSSVSQVVGQVPQATIGAGAPVLSTYLARPLSTHVQNGYRAVAVHVDKVIAVGDHLHPGDFVDVFFTLPAAQAYGAGPQQNAPAQGRMLLPDLRVLAVGPQTVARVAPEQTTDAFGNAQNQPANQPPQAPPQPPTSVVLQVPVGEVAKLVTGAENGKLLLALRNPKDDAQPDTAAFPSAPPAIEPTLLPVAQRKDALQVPDNKAYAGLTLPGLREPEKPAARAVARGEAPRPRPSVEIYRGDQKQTVSY